MVPAIVAQPGAVDDLLPGLINVFGLLAWLEGTDGSVEGILSDCGDRCIFIPYSADTDQASEWCVIARNATRKLEEHGLA